MQKKAILLCADDWEGLYIEGSLYSEGHWLNEPEFWINVTNEFGINEDNFSNVDVIDEDLEYLYNNGNFPKNISELKGDY